jgi:hypothetical protein
MVLEIRQTLLHIRCVAFGPVNRAEAYSARLLEDQLGERFRLAYLYRAAPVDITTTSEGDVHEGVTVLDLNEKDTPRTLRGFYLNTRTPQARKAFVQLTFSRRSLLDRFAQVSEVA